MKALIVANVPTHYQYRSLKAFKLEITKEYLNGSYAAWQEFDTLKQAKKYLKDLAYDYYNGNKEELARYYGVEFLELDACTAYIITGLERKEYLISRKIVKQ